MSVCVVSTKTGIPYRVYSCTVPGSTVTHDQSEVDTESERMIIIIIIIIVIIIIIIMR